jgi:glucan phosphoethanolaminetransferase (alkaline phosphatase superfamily)
MEDQELKDIWAAYDKKLEEARILNLQSWALNLKCFEELQTHKVRSKLSSLANFKWIAIVLGIVYVLFLGMLVYFVRWRNIYFSVSISMIVLITLIALVVYIKQIVIIKQINYSDSITDTQEKLSTLQSSTINIVRIAWLQLPFWSTWFWSSKWILYDPMNFWLIAFPITLFFAGLAIWLYRNISIKNRDKKWFTILFGHPEWTSIRKAMEFMKEIEVFKQDLNL